MKHSRLLLAVTCLALAPVAGLAKVNRQMLVSTQWLADHLGDKTVVVLHVGRDKTAYDAGHIPGACFVPFAKLTATRDGVPVELPPVAELKGLFQSCGVGDRTRVVLSGDMLSLLAARAYFTLDYLGHAGHAALLDGGLEQWKAEKRPLSKEAPVARKGTLTPKPRPQIVIGLEAMKNLSAKPAGSVIIDSRRPEDFKGAKDPDLPRVGHIPGAVNAFWMDDLVSREQPALKSEPELRRRYDALGVPKAREIVTYCRTGVQATMTYFTLKYLGYSPAMYDGSFIEWSRAAGTTVEPTGSVQ